MHPVQVCSTTFFRDSIAHRHIQASTQLEISIIEGDNHLMYKQIAEHNSISSTHPCRLDSEHPPTKMPMQYTLTVLAERNDMDRKLIGITHHEKACETWYLYHFYILYSISNELNVADYFPEYKPFSLSQMWHAKRSSTAQETVTMTWVQNPKFRWPHTKSVNKRNMAQNVSYSYLVENCVVEKSTAPKHYTKKKQLRDRNYYAKRLRTQLNMADRSHSW